MLWMNSPGMSPALPLKHFALIAQHWKQKRCCGMRDSMLSSLSPVLWAAHEVPSNASVLKMQVGMSQRQDEDQSDTHCIHIIHEQTHTSQESANLLFTKSLTFGDCKVFVKSEQKH